MIKINPFKWVYKQIHLIYTLYKTREIKKLLDKAEAEVHGNTFGPSTDNNYYYPWQASKKTLSIKEAYKLEKERGRFL